MPRGSRLNPYVQDDGGIRQFLSIDRHGKEGVQYRFRQEGTMAKWYKAVEWTRFLNCSDKWSRSIVDDFPNYAAVSPEIIQTLKDEMVCSADDFITVANLRMIWECQDEHIDSLFKAGKLRPFYRFKDEIKAIAIENDGREKLNSILRAGPAEDILDGLFAIERYDNIAWRNNCLEKGDISLCILSRKTMEEERYRPIEETIIAWKDFEVIKADVIRLEPKMIADKKVEVYDQNEAAGLVGQTPDTILKWITSRDEEDGLTPFIYLDWVKATITPNSPCAEGQAGTVILRGFYSVEGLAPHHKTKITGKYKISFGGKSRIFLHKGLNMFLLQEEIYRTADELYVSAEEINAEVDKKRSNTPPERKYPVITVQEDEIYWSPQWLAAHYGEAIGSVYEKMREDGKVFTRKGWMSLSDYYVLPIEEREDREVWGTAERGFIPPSVYYNTDIEVEMRDYDKYSQKWKISGPLQVKGLFLLGPLTWRANETAIIESLSQGGVTYYPVKRRSVRWDELVISKSALEVYYEQYGKPTKGFPPAERRADDPGELTDGIEEPVKDTSKKSNQQDEANNISEIDTKNKEEIKDIRPYKPRGYKQKAIIGAYNAYLKQGHDPNARDILTFMYTRSYRENGELLPIKDMPDYIAILGKLKERNDKNGIIGIDIKATGVKFCIQTSKCKITFDDFAEIFRLIERKALNKPPRTKSYLNTPS
jgi:hypothetical protein